MAVVELLLSPLPSHVRVVIGEYRRKDYRDAVAAMGFTVVEASQPDAS